MEMNLADFCHSVCIHLQAPPAGTCIFFNNHTTFYMEITRSKLYNFPNILMEKFTGNSIRAEKPRTSPFAKKGFEGQVTQ